jgi:uncharacterized protein
MNEPLKLKIWELAQRLRRQGISIGVDDYAALQQSLRAGFGWGSRDEFFDLCSSLWAKSMEEQLLRKLFDELFPKETWNYSLPKPTGDTTPEKPPAGDTTSNELPAEETTSIDKNPPNEPKSSEGKGGENLKEPDSEQEIKTEKSQGGIPPIDFQGVEMSTRRFIFVPEFPLSDREITQTWRRLRQRVDVSRGTDLDVPTTIDRWSRSGVLTNLVLRPRQRNMARLVDRQGSMAPFHGFCEHLCGSIVKSSQLGATAIYYFHNLLAEGANEEVLDPLAGELFPRLDSILGKIQPCSEGDIYTDGDLLKPTELKKVLELHARDSLVVIISDAGAARSGYRGERLLETIAFMKALRTYNSRYVWLNPLAESYWRGVNNTAGQIARHIPMFSLDREGMERSINVLRGQEYPIEKSI